MLLPFFILFPFFLIWLKPNKGINKISYILLLKISVFAFLLFLSTIVLAQFNLYWRGYKSTSFIIILWGLSSIIFYYSFPMLDKNMDTKFVAGFFMYFIVLITTVSSWWTVDSYKDDLYYNDNKYRLEEGVRGIMSPPRLPILFVKNWIFEKKYSIEKKDPNMSMYGPSENYIPKNKIKKILINEIANNIIEIKFEHIEDTNRKNNLLIITKKID